MTNDPAPARDAGNANDVGDQRRPVRSFVRREGRITPGQRRALEELSRRYGVAAEPHKLSPQTLFAESKCCVLEIGFGDGESLLAQAEAEPDSGFLGIEVHRPGVGHLLGRLDQLALNNVRVACQDAVELVEQRLPEATLDRVQVFFPDPWPKARHHKRRLIQPPFVATLASRLKPGGLLHLATDWQPYAEHMLETLRGEPRLRNTVAEFAPRPASRPLTKFERRGLARGHGVFDLVFAKTAPAPSGR